MKRKLFTLLMLLVSVLGVVAISNTVDAANTDNSKEKWYAIGTINGTSWNTDFALTYDATDDRYELEIALTAGNEFKIRKDKAWTTSIGYGGNTGSGISTYLSKSGENFKVKTTGNYILWVKDDNVRNYGDKSYGFGIDKIEAVNHTVTHYSKDGQVLKTETISDKTAYTPAFEEIDGFALEGWYTDAALTQKITKGTIITSDLTLYPKYVEANDYVVYVSADVLGDKVNAYMWSDSLDGHFNGAWPGVALEKDARGWKVEIDASKSFDKIIFNNGTSQTVDLSLTDVADMDTFVLGNKNTEGKYAATVNKTGVYYSLVDLMNPYYNGGVYTRTTHIYIDKDAIASDFGTHFHNPQGGDNVLLERTTEFVGNYLYFVETNVGFGTSAEGKLTQFTWTEGFEHASTGEKNAIEDSFYTIYDLMNTEAEWTYADGVYTTNAATVIKIAEGFTAPGWKSPDTNYTNYSKVVVYVNEASQLVIELYVSAIDEGIVTSTPVGGHCLFSQAIIG